MPRAFSANLFQGIPHEINVCLLNKWQALTFFFFPIWPEYLFYFIFFLNLRKKIFCSADVEFLNEALRAQEVDETFKALEGQCRKC